MLQLYNQEQLDDREADCTFHSFVIQSIWTIRTHAKSETKLEHGRKWNVCRVDCTRIKQMPGTT